MANTITRPIEVLAGVQPSTDFTSQSTPHYTFTDKVRFVDGIPEKIGGWTSVTFESKFGINGCPRNIYSFTLTNTINYLVGTHTNLYHVSNDEVLTNVTPVVTSATTLNNVYSTFHGTLANDPIATTLGSRTITVTDTAHKLLDTDLVSFTGSSAVNGIPAIEINTTFVVFNVTTNTYDVSVATTAATSTGSGGGAAVVRATRIVSVVDTNTFTNGDNIEISNTAASVGGISAANIDGVRRIQAVTGSGYDIVADSDATSSVSGAGGNTDIKEEIPDGLCDPTTGAGYGLGQYGVGQYGVSKTASSPTFPTIWSFDRFGNIQVFTQGTQTGLYEWDGSVTTLPTLVSGAPTAINYTFVSNEIVVTLGASGTGNRIQWSDQGDRTDWTATAVNQAGQDDIEGASTFFSHAKFRGFNLLFTEREVYTFRYIRKPFIWETKLLDPARGLIAQNARIVVNGVAYWMGADNFYQYRGGNVEIIPSNSTTQTTLIKFIYENINLSQVSKIFCWYNEEFSEIWWHYPSDGSNDPDRIARFNVRDLTWTPDTLERTAAEYPSVLDTLPRLIDVDGKFYKHENGTDDDGVSLPFQADTRTLFTGNDTAYILGIIPDSIQVGDIQVDVKYKKYPQSTEITPPAFPVTVTTTTEIIDFRANARYYNYSITGNVLGQSWRGGAWAEVLEKGTPK